MAKAISGFFRTRKEGEAAQDALLSSGFTRDEVSFIAGDTAAQDTPKIGPVYGTGAEEEAGTDAWIGGAAGLAAGVIAMAIPGLGPLFVAGPIAGAVAGLTAGAAAGGFIGLLRDAGVSDEEAEFYEEGVRRGGSLVTVHGVSGDRAGRAKDILDHAGAIHVEDLADELQHSGWKGKVRKAG
ncbi:MAG: hypothetical protein LAQ30_17185 [Acidobacteriia bacterium]|nr:hypothetical protein [Terriglobia bacterium]